MERFIKGVIECLSPYVEPLKKNETIVLFSIAKLTKYFNIVDHEHFYTYYKHLMMIIKKMHTKKSNHQLKELICYLFFKTHILKGEKNVLKMYAHLIPAETEIFWKKYFENK